MNVRPTTAARHVLVAGLGSSWGDDRLGWLAVERLTALCRTRSGDARSGDSRANDVQTGDVQAGDVQAGDVQAGDVQTGDVPSGEINARSEACHPPGQRSTATLLALRSPLDLLDHLPGVDQVHLIDACAVEGLPGEVPDAPPPGTLLRLAWPDPRFARLAFRGTHDLRLPAVLELAARLSLLPPAVELWAVVIRPPPRGGRPTRQSLEPEGPDTLEAALAPLIAQLAGQLQLGAIPRDGFASPELAGWHHA